ncbi:MAG: NAD(P)-dependent oxidoreductase [Saprospiraceae bacterium]|nr:NAD(P)-dependent oxidoreductase [Saprospiraceae bacterium]
MDKIGLTGADGFVGTHLVKRLKNEGYDLLISDCNLNHHIPSFEDCKHVIHLAALTFVPQSWEQPNLFYQTNTVGTAHVLEAVRKANIPLTYISSYVYGNPQYLPIDEEHELIPSNPYMQSKIMAEEICNFYRENFDLEICILRPFNLYGSGLSKKFLIPLICEQVLDKNKKKIHLRSLTPKRDYIHIDDLISAILKSIKRPNSESINIASGDSYNVKEIAEMIMNICSIHKEIVSDGTIRLNEIMDTKADISLAKKVLDWKPQVKIETGIEKIISEMK